jgi:hypothetical protein
MHEKAVPQLTVVFSINDHGVQRVVAAFGGIAAAHALPKFHGQ